MAVLTFERVSKGCHPALNDLFAFLESLSMKDKQAFAASFGSLSSIGFFANLPGGVRVTDPNKLIEMHDEFFESSVSQFEYSKLNNGVGGEDFFTCSVPAKVTFPNGTKREVCIDMTFFKNQDAWVPARLINTVVDPSQAVLES